MNKSDTIRVSAQDIESVEASVSVQLTRTPYLVLFALWLLTILIYPQIFPMVEKNENY